MARKVVLSLCVIVRGQHDLLRDMLLHHSELYDEAVVVDTDESPLPRDWAALPGVRAAARPWRDDFAEARNHGLELARGEKILILDCDEKFAPEDFQLIRRLATDPRHLCHFFPQLNYFPAPRGHGWEETGPGHAPYCLGAPGFQSVWTPRLFPNLPGVRYRGAVHESMEEGIRQKLLQPCKQDINLHHLGHMLKYPRAQGRVAFYGQLLRKKLKQQPDDPCARYEMAVHLAGTGEDGLARTLLENTLNRFEAWATRHRARLLLGDILCRQGLAAKATFQFESALQERPQWLAAWEAVVKIHLRRRMPWRAWPYLVQAQRLFPLHHAWDGFHTQVLTMMDDNQEAVEVNWAVPGAGHSENRPGARPEHDSPVG